MRRAAQALAVIVAVVIAAALAAAIVRELAIATSRRAGRATPGWWHRLLTDHSLTWLAFAAMAAMAVIAMVCFVLAIRIVGRERRPVSLFELGETGARVAVKAEALEHLVIGALNLRVPDLRVTKTSLRRIDDSLWAIVTAEAQSADLAGLHDAATTVAADELRHATGLGLAGLDVVFTRLWIDAGGTQ